MANLSNFKSLGSFPRKKLKTFDKKRKKSNKLILKNHRKVSAKKIITFFTAPYKLTSQVNLAKPLRNACERIVFHRH